MVQDSGSRILIPGSRMHGPGWLSFIWDPESRMVHVGPKFIGILNITQDYGCWTKVPQARVKDLMSLGTGLQGL